MHEYAKTRQQHDVVGSKRDVVSDNGRMVAISFVV